MLSNAQMERFGVDLFDVGNPVAIIVFQVIFVGGLFCDLVVLVQVSDAGPRLVVAAPMLLVYVARCALPQSGIMTVAV